MAACLKACLMVICPAGVVEVGDSMSAFIACSLEGLISPITFTILLVTEFLFRLIAAFHWVFSTLFEVIC